MEGKGREGRGREGQDSKQGTQRKEGSIYKKKRDEITTTNINFPSFLLQAYLGGILYTIK